MLATVIADMTAVQELLLTEMSVSGAESIRVDGYTVYQSSKIAAKCVDREAATPILEAWVPDLVKPSFSLQTLSAHLREQYRQSGGGNVAAFVASLPDDVRQVIEVREWYQIGARKG